MLCNPIFIDRAYYIPQSITSHTPNQLYIESAWAGERSTQTDFKYRIRNRAPRPSEIKVEKVQPSGFNINGRILCTGSPFSLHSSSTEGKKKPIVHRFLCSPSLFNASYAFSSHLFFWARSCHSVSITFSYYACIFELFKSPCHYNYHDARWSLKFYPFVCLTETDD